MDATAVAGEDYEPVFATLAWQDGDAAPKTLEVPLALKPELDGEELFLVRLSDAFGGAVFAEPTTVAVVLSEATAEAVEIPTLSPWGLALLVLVLAAAGWRVVRSRSLSEGFPPTRRRPSSPLSRKRCDPPAVTRPDSGRSC